MRQQGAGRGLAAEDAGQVGCGTWTASQDLGACGTCGAPAGVLGLECSRRGLAWVDIPAVWVTEDDGSGTWVGSQGSARPRMKRCEYRSGGPWRR